MHVYVRERRKGRKGWGWREETQGGCKQVGWNPTRRWCQESSKVSEEGGAKLARSEK